MRQGVGEAEDAFSRFGRAGAPGLPDQEADPVLPGVLGVGGDVLDDGLDRPFFRRRRPRPCLDRLRPPDNVAAREVGGTRDERLREFRRLEPRGVVRPERFPDRVVAFVSLFDLPDRPGDEVAAREVRAVGLRVRENGAPGGEQPLALRPPAGVGGNVPYRRRRAAFPFREEFRPPRIVPVRGRDVLVDPPPRRLSLLR